MNSSFSFFYFRFTAVVGASVLTILLVMSTSGNYQVIFLFVLCYKPWSILLYLFWTWPTSFYIIFYGIIRIFAPNTSILNVLTAQLDRRFEKNLLVWVLIHGGFTKLLSNCHENYRRHYLTVLSTRRFSKLVKFSANCHLVHDWTCFVDKL